MCGLKRGSEDPGCRLWLKKQEHCHQGHLTILVPHELRQQASLGDTAKNGKPGAPPQGSWTVPAQGSQIFPGKQGQVSVMCLRLDFLPQLACKEQDLVQF